MRFVNEYDDEDLVRPKRCYCVKHLPGKILTGITWTFLTFLYFLTVFYGIFGCTFSNMDLCMEERKELGLILHMIAFTLVYLMMMWSHCIAQHQQCISLRAQHRAEPPCAHILCCAMLC